MPWLRSHWFALPAKIFTLMQAGLFAAHAWSSCKRYNIDMPDLARWQDHGHPTICATLHGRAFSPCQVEAQVALIWLWLEHMSKFSMAASLYFVAITGLLALHALCTHLHIRVPVDTVNHNYRVTRGYVTHVQKTIQGSHDSPVLSKTAGALRRDY